MNKLQKHSHETYIEAYNRCGSARAAGRELGVPHVTVMRHVHNERRKNNGTASDGAAATSFKQNGDTGLLQSRKGKRIVTLEQLLDYSQTDLKTWEVRDHVVNSWEVTAKGSDGELVKDFNFQVKAWLTRRIPGIDFADQASRLKAELLAFSPALPSYDYDDCGEHLFEVDLYDVHYGKLCWKGESGQNMDSKIARSRVLRAVCTLIERGRWFGIDRILFPVGNDFFNSDNQYDTTAKGTKQHEDGRWQKTFLEGKDLLVEIINMMRSVAPVDIILVQGNHDFERSFYVAAVLDAFFNNAPDVTVCLDGNQRKYYQYGKNLIGLTHGEGVPVKELPLTMAQESKEMWAATSFREFHAGHIHHKKELQTITTKEYKGVLVRYLRSLTGIDAWHSWKGFIGSQQSAEAFLFHKANGPVANLMVNFSETDELI